MAVIPLHQFQSSQVPLLLQATHKYLFQPKGEIELSQRNNPFSFRNEWRSESLLSSELIDIASNYRLQYCFHTPQKETLPAWKGACWCSEAKIGDFPYGPAPDDPSLPSTLILRFFEYHYNFLKKHRPALRKLDTETESEFCRQCVILGYFEMILRQGLYNCYQFPIFQRKALSVQDLLAIPTQNLVDDVRQKADEKYTQQLSEYAITHSG